MPVKVLPNQTTGVRLSKYFAQTTEVTKGFYYGVMKDNPNGFVVTRPSDSEKNKPVECGFLEAALFCNRLSKQCGLRPVYGIMCKVYMPNDSSSYAYRLQTDPDVWDFSFTINYKRYLCIDKTANGFRLPTDAEYLYAMGSGYGAVMSGSTVDHYIWKDSNNVSHNISDIGWTSETNVLEPQTVAQKIPNEYGLYDLSGNVSEWACDTYYSGTTMQSFIDNSVNYIQNSGSIPSSSYMTSYAKHGYYSAPAALYNMLTTTYSESNRRVDEGGSYLKDESYAVPYSDTKYPTNNKTRNSDMDSVDLVNNGDGTYSCGTYSHGFRIVKQTPPYLLDKWDGEYKFLMPGAGTFEPLPLKKIIAGCFYQGAQSTDITMPNYDVDALANEGPVHKVLLTSDFYMSIEKIPVNLWLNVMELNNNYINNINSSNCSRLTNSTSYNYWNNGIIPNDANFCMYNMLHSRAKITWRKAMVFCNRLSRLLGLEPVYHYEGNYNEEEWQFTTTGTNKYADYVIGQNGSSLVDTIQVDKSKHGFRLPTESEFEYVWKGGFLKDTFKYPGSNDPTKTGTQITSSTVRTNQQFYNFVPNSLGFYDLASVVTEFMQDSAKGIDNAFVYNDTTYYPQPRSGEDFVINPIVEAESSWDYNDRRCHVIKGINSTHSYSYFSSMPWRIPLRGGMYSGAIDNGSYKYQNSYSENFRLVLQSPEVLPENMTPTYKMTKSINVILDYKQEPTNCINNSCINDSRGYDHYNIRNYQILPDKLSFNTIQVPISSYNGSTSYMRNKNIKIVYENQFMNYDNSLNSGTEYNNMQFFYDYNNYYIEVMEVPLTIEMYRVLYPECSELEYYNNYYANSNNDPSSYRQYYGISWYKAIEICNKLTEMTRNLKNDYSGYPRSVFKINNSMVVNNWTSIPVDETSAVADYTNYSGSGGCWNDPIICNNNYSQDAANNFYTISTTSYEGMPETTGWRLPTCMEMLYITFGGDSRYNDTQLYPGSNEISDVSCFKIVDNSGNEVTDYTQVTNLTDYHLESKNGLTYAEGYSKNKMYKPNCFNIYDLATNCCLCYDFLESTDNPGTDGKFIAPLKLSNGTSGYRRCCVFGVPSGVDHTTDTNSLAHYSMRLFTEVKPWESYPFQSLRLVRTLSGYLY